MPQGRGLLKAWSSVFFTMPLRVARKMKPVFSKSRTANTRGHLLPGLERDQVDHGLALPCGPTSGIS